MIYKYDKFWFYFTPGNDKVEMNFQNTYGEYFTECFMHSDTAKSLITGLLNSDYESSTYDTIGKQFAIVLYKLD